MGLGGDAQLDGVGVAHPQRRGAAPYAAAVPLGGAEVGGVVVVDLDVLPVGPLAAGGAGADLYPAPQLGGGVVPDDPEQGERPYGAGRRPSVPGVGTVVVSRSVVCGPGAPSVATGRDWVLPGRSPVLVAPGTAAGAGAALAPAVGARERARAAVHTAPRQVTRKGRMDKILDMGGPNAPTVA